MKFKETKIKGVYLIHLDKIEDSRGFFARYFCSKEFSKKKLNTKWVQINNSLNKKVGTLRGLHYQKKPNQEIKLVRCIKGSIWDVVVDLRKKSKTFGRWFGAELNENNRKMMYVPKGCAHGIISLKKNSETLYLVSTYYNKNSEVTINWRDPDLSINWPIKPKLISNKDLNGINFQKINKF